MTNSNDLVAKLLATENITVVHQNVSTASFDLKNRVLTLPMWKDMESFTYDHLNGHEVGHALYTPIEDWQNAVRECEEKAYKSFLNVVEDARIEKLIQRRYPGLRSSFIKSYKKLLNDGFFGISEKDTSSLSLIDRLNIHFKCGFSAGIKFSSEEKKWVNRIEKLETFEEVKQLVDELYRSEKEKVEDMIEEMQSEINDLDGLEFDDEDGEGLDFDDEMDDDSEESLDEMDDDSEKSLDEMDDDSEKSLDEMDDDSEESLPDNNPDRRVQDNLEAKTVEVLENNIKQNFSETVDDNSLVWNHMLPDRDHHELIVSYKNIMSLFDTPVDEENRESWKGFGWHDKPVHPDEYFKDAFESFYKRNKRHVSLMVKEFQMRQKASEYKRTTINKTGVLDTLKMNNHKFSDDIFRRVSVVQEGKNHGLIMFLDWSGSMTHRILPTTEQVISLATFCRQISVPFRVYGFSNTGDFERFFPNSSENVNPSNLSEVSRLSYDSNFKLLEFLSSDMNKATFTKASMRLYSTAKCLGPNRDDMYSGHVCIPRDLGLGGTPLVDAIMAAFPIHDEFKNKYNLDLVSTFFLTDGMSHNLEYSFYDPRLGRYVREEISSYNRRYNIHNIVDPVTKKSVRISIQRNISGRKTMPQDALIELYKHRTGSITVGYGVVNKNSKSSVSDVIDNYCDWQELHNFQKKLKKEEYAIFDKSAYDRHFIVDANALSVPVKEIEVEDGASKSKIRSAFRRSLGNNKTGKRMINDIMEIIA